MNYIYIIIGFITLSLGILGIFLPVLPTTPFLLLTAFFFARGSEKYYDWLLNHRILGTYIKNFREDRSVTLRVKFLSITLMWATTLLSVFWVLAGKLWIQLLLLAISVAVTIHILSFKTKR